MEHWAIEVQLFSLPERMFPAVFSLPCQFKMQAQSTRVRTAWSTKAASEVAQEVEAPSSRSNTTRVRNPLAAITKGTKSRSHPHQRQLSTLKNRALASSKTGPLIITCSNSWEVKTGSAGSRSFLVDCRLTEGALSRQQTSTSCSSTSCRCRPGGIAAPGSERIRREWYQLICSCLRVASVNFTGRMLYIIK